MKKGTYISLLFLATLALLTNVIIPHHHHDAEICFEDLHHDAACDPEEHKHAEIDHGDTGKHTPVSDHDGPEDHQQCILDFHVILPVHQARSNSESFPGSTEHSVFDGSIALLPKAPAEALQIQGDYISRGPLILRSYISSQYGSPGMRAPPVC